MASGMASLLKLVKGCQQEPRWYVKNFIICQLWLWGCLELYMVEVRKEPSKEATLKTERDDNQCLFRRILLQ